MNGIERDALQSDDFRHLEAWLTKIGMQGFRVYVTIVKGDLERFQVA